MFYYFMFTKTEPHLPLGGCFNPVLEILFCSSFAAVVPLQVDPMQNIYEQVK